MSQLLLERLSKKNTKKAKMKPMEIKLEKGQVAVKIQLVKSNTDYDFESLKQKLKNRGLSAPKISKESVENLVKTVINMEEKMEEKVDPKPKKLNSKTKLPGKKIDKSKIRTKREKKTIDEIILDIPATLIQVEERALGDRLSEKEPSVNIKAPAYYMNNREMFINFINSTFRKYGKLLKNQEEDGSITCDSLNNTKSKSFSLMIHQQIVRDYINIYTPYRGLLLYHGLGAGKTCASIAIAEGLKNTNQVIIMTPASLRMNYINELKNCGDPIYKLNQFWEKIATAGNLHLEKALSEILNLPVSFIRKQGWAWMVDVKKQSNFDKLVPEDQKSIDLQINEMLLKKYKFINYNGMREEHLDKMITESEELHNTSNPFDDKVIIIDEAHNFVSRIVNKLKGKKTSLSTKLYELILSANNCRVVFLTGTPIINYPNEIGVLFNMLRGYIKTFYLKLDTSDTRNTINQKYMLEIFKKEKLLDYIEYNPSKKPPVLIVTRNPFGFTNRVKKQGDKNIYAGVSSNKSGLVDDNKFISFITKTLKNHNIKVLPKQTQVENHKALPDILETFKDLFIDPVTGEMKQQNLFKRRIVGLTSYFRSASESLLPKYEDTPKYYHIEKIPMSTFQVGVYEKARAAERKEEDRNAKKKAKQQQGVYDETASTYRIFSRAYCNFVFPNEIVEDDDNQSVLLSRPMPKSDQTLEHAISTKITESDEETKTTNKDKLDEDILDAINIEDKLDNQDGLYTMDDVEQLEQQTRQQTDSSYKDRINNALNLLVKYGEKYFSPSGLALYSPKFKKLVENLKNPPTSTTSGEGLHLIYSQFRTIEGIGVLTLILNQNGFTRFKISKRTGTWELDIAEADRGKPTYALYTGTETSEEKEIIRNVFNSSWDSIPSTLATQLKEINQNNNLGEIIKILMITSSGSEGITLKNTRFVHLVEPYWHPVRTDQVIGRARRICSHKDLPESLRSVEVFVYLMTFTDKQINGDKEAANKEDRQPILSLALRNSKADKSKIDRITPLTSDEALFEISNIKKTTTNSILRAIKSSSIDCALHFNSNKKEGFACYSFGAPSVNSFSHKPNYSAEEKDSVAAQNLKGVTWEAFPITIQGTKYALKRTDPTNKKLGEIYDLESYLTAKNNPNINPILIGRTIINPKNPKKIQFLNISDEI
uniref:Helicase ATP-binding domain-containing protein n=1 Tax=viral metagenome TaxID=1070528 RepID=A0A6C0JAZ6_9ZZZZ